MKKSTPKNIAPTRRRGRPPLEESGTCVLTLRVTERQKETFDMLGRVHWLRSELEQLRAELERKNERERRRAAAAADPVQR